MKIDILNLNGKSTGQVELDTSVFGIEPREVLLTQYLRVFLFNKRQGTSDVKDRSEVSGGGKKPWRQKGSGRARHGSSRSPLWKGGGTVHGPSPKDWRLRLPKKMRALAVISALSAKAAKGKIFVVENPSVSAPKTSEMAKKLKETKLTSPSTLIVLADNDLNFRKSVENLPWVSTALAQNLNAFEVLKAKKVVFVKEALDQITEKYSGRFRNK